MKLFLTVNSLVFLVAVFLDAHTVSYAFVLGLQKSQISSQKINRFQGKNPHEMQVGAVERPLFIGSFNVQTLGKKKLSNDYIMVNLEKVVLRYDLILITELMTNDKRQINRFINNINRFAPEGVKYSFIMNNDTTTNEYCMFIYRTDKLRVLKTDTYVDTENFYRMPFFVLFDSPTLRDMSSFGVIGHHVKPDKAVKEINTLADVYDFMSSKHKIEDVLLMGDFNADCTYVKEGDWDKISLWTRSEFTWPLGNHVDTTTNYKSCALDRFVYAGENMNSGVILSTARAFNLQEELEITQEEARSLSDHKPIEMKIRGKVSKTSEKHLSSESCFTVKDSRNSNITQPQIMKAAKIAFYKATVAKNGIFLLSKKAKYLEEMITSLNNLRNIMPTTFKQEQLEAIVYKLENGALNDQSSFADEQNIIFRIDFQISNDHCTMIICKTSTIN